MYNEYGFLLDGETSKMETILRELRQEHRLKYGIDYATRHKYGMWHFYCSSVFKDTICEVLKEHNFTEYIINNNLKMKRGEGLKLIVNWLKGFFIYLFWTKEKGFTFKVRLRVWWAQRPWPFPWRNIDG